MGWELLSAFLNPVQMTVEQSQARMCGEGLEDAAHTSVECEMGRQRCSIAKLERDSNAAAYIPVASEALAGQIEGPR